MTDLPVAYQSPITMNLDQCIVAWLSAKSKRSGSAKTEKAYSDAVYQFRIGLQSQGLDLDSPSSVIAPLAQGFADTSTKDRSVSPATFNQRIAILSSFYEYAITMEVLEKNPIKKIEKRKVNNEHAAHALQDDEVTNGLESIDRSTGDGKRDYAMLSVMFTTGRRVDEIASMTMGDIRKSGRKAVVRFPHCKGDKQMTDTLPPDVTKVLYEYLHFVYGEMLLSLPDTTPVWVAFSDRCKGKSITTRTFQRTCGKYLGTSKAHTTRHTFSLGMEKEGANINQISKALGHSNIATTNTYMDRIRESENPFAEKLTIRYGIK